MEYPDDCEITVTPYRGLRIVAARSEVPTHPGPTRPIGTIPWTAPIDRQIDLASEAGHDALWIDMWDDLDDDPSGNYIPN